MIEAVSVGLNQLVLWYDGTRIQTWPTFLSTVPDTLYLPSATDFGRRFDTERMTDQRHSAAEKIVRNLPGLEAKNGRVILKGCRLLLTLTPNWILCLSRWKQTAGIIRRRPEGQRLGETTRKANARKRAKDTRRDSGALSVEGAELRFEGKKWFGGSLRKARILVSLTVVTTYPFPWRRMRRCTTLRTLLREHSWWALGEWRKAIPYTALKASGELSFHGHVTRAPSHFLDVGLGSSRPV